MLKLIARAFGLVLAALLVSAVADIHKPYWPHSWALDLWYTVTLAPAPTWLEPRIALSQAPCDYYASPTGTSSNNGLTPSTPFRPRDFWGKNGGGLGLAGKTLCLMDGLYTGAAYMLYPGRRP